MPINFQQLASSANFNATSQNPLTALAEYSRQAQAQDDMFFRNMLYYFELEVPQELSGPENRFLFPLVLNPESYSMSEPFQAELTPTTGGGLYAEENGIVQRRITISGTTGFKPRPLQGNGISALNLITPDKRSFSRKLATDILKILSGQRHFQYLQDAVFRTYSDLKQNPATAAGTRLYWHVPKDDEHWRVIPVTFDLDRSSDKRTLYPYRIEMIAVQRADTLQYQFTEDIPVLTAIKDNYRMISSGADLIAGSVRDLNALQADLGTYVTNVGTLLDNVTNIVTACREFLDGTTNLVQTPLAGVGAAQRLVDEITAALQDVTEVPDHVVQSFRAIGDGLARLGTHPGSFETPSQAEMRLTKNRQELSLSVSQETLDAAQAADPPASLKAARKVGTGLTPGEVDRASGELGVGRLSRNYTSSREHAVASGDTLMSLAAAYLGDARYWQDIAIVNNLKPPYVVDQFTEGIEESILSGTISVGQKLRIPNYTKPVTELVPLAVLGVSPDANAEEHLLGRDFTFVEVSRKKYDFVVDVEAGAEDFKQVRGIDNLKQVVILRLTIEKGTDLLYKQVGVARVIGLGLKPVDLENVRFRITETVNADPRIATVRKLDMNLVAEQDPDRVQVEADAEVRGLLEPLRVTALV